MKVRVISLLAVLAIAIVAFGTFTACAQYNTPVIQEATIVDGKAEVTGAADAKVEVYGTSGAEVTVSTTLYTDDPQPAATRDDGTRLAKFFVIEFDMNEDDFEYAILTIPFTEADVANMAAPYVLLKYDPDTNTYKELPEAMVDFETYTITVVLQSTTDPLFALAGTDTATPAPTEEPTPMSTYALIVGAVAAILVVIAIIGLYQRKKK
jgi:hypothetical protein